MAYVKPSEWVTRIANDAEAFIKEYEGFDVAHVFLEPGAAVGPDECCAGALAVDVVNWFATSEIWPNQRAATEKREPCDGAAAMAVNLKYVTCVTGMDNNGRMPNDKTRQADQLAVMDLGWALWRYLLHQESGEWRKKYGTTRIGAATRNPTSGGCTGFTIQLQAKLPTC